MDVARLALGLLSLSTIVGVVLFLGLTFVIQLISWGKASDGEAVATFCLAMLVLALIHPRTRKTAVAFVLTFVVLTPFDVRYTKVWWSPVTSAIYRWTRPAARYIERGEKYRAWIEARKGHPVEVKDALVLLRNLNTGCIPSFNTLDDRTPPADVAAIFARPDCNRFEPSLYNSKAEYPARYYPSDTGWRWDYVRTDEPGGRYRVTLRPDRLLELQGPILEVTGDGWYRIRASEKAPLKMLLTPIPLMRRVRECMKAAEARADPANPIKWGFGSLPSFIRSVCKDLLVDSEQDSSEGDAVIRVRRVRAEPDVMVPTLVHYRERTQGRFELRGWSFGRRYLLDGDGVLHAASALGSGTLADGPPLACELDPGVECK
jgi:hypothetical protein